MNTTTFLMLSLSIIISLNAYSQGSWIRDEAKITEAVDFYDLSGDGALIVMIDRGIDYRHPDFIDNAGNTRIAYIYDMIDPSGANDPDNPYGIGTIWDETEINQALANNTTPPLTNDNHGHGTATTGIMCGDGSGIASREFKGVAPGAKIISIKFVQDGFPAFGSNPGEAGFFNISLLETALDFAHNKITELDLPSVTLMNFGSVGGPTDGTSLICRQMDAFVDLGHTLVCGVGDDGGADNRAAGSIAQGQTIEIDIDKVTTNLRFDLWYDEADRFEVSVQRPNGMIEGPFSAPTSSEDFNDRFLTNLNIFHRGADVEFHQALSPRRELLIDFAGATGVYKVILTGTTINGSGDFNAVLNPSRFSSANAFLNFIGPQGSINDFSAAFKVISPTDYVIDNSWTDIDGIPRSIVNQGAPGEIWVGSSEGPTQDGRIGTDVAAPGEVCAAAYSKDSFYGNFSFNTLQNGNGYYGIQNAVSASAPVTVGVIALMLEANPNLTPLEVREILHSSATADNFTQAVPNSTWGYGKLNAEAAVRLALRGSADIIVSDDFIDISTRTSNNLYTIRGDISNYNIALLNSLGNVVTNYAGFSDNALSINLSGVASGSRFIRVNHKTNNELSVLQLIE